ncbi:hypothetical protein [Cytobacillus kochii]|uniref:hypothetical protein n=1 Tax=Cytobacillus kochii TaxID=859143 RepID=UPI00402A8553
MAFKRPKFLDSPYYKDGKLRPGAPADVRQEYKEFMAYEEHKDLKQPKILTEEDINRL